MVGQKTFNLFASAQSLSVYLFGGYVDNFLQHFQSSGSLAT